MLKKGKIFKLIFLSHTSKLLSLFYKMLIQFIEVQHDWKPFCDVWCKTVIRQSSLCIQYSCLQPLWDSFVFGSKALTPVFDYKEPVCFRVNFGESQVLISFIPRDSPLFGQEEYKCCHLVLPIYIWPSSNSKVGCQKTGGAILGACQHVFLVWHIDAG